MLIHRRQQELITLLLQRHDWCTLEEIAQYIQCSEKTVHRDLLYLKDHLPSKWKIQVVKGKGVKLYKPVYCSSTSVYSLFKKNDITFQVLDQLLHGNVRTVAELASTLYIPTSSITRGLRDVQQYLAPFKLQLQKKPLRIIGIEPHIVYMFYELYFTTYNWEEWPFEDLPEILQYISNIEQKLDMQLYPVYKQRMAYLLAIAIIRKKQGYQMDILPVYEKLVVDTVFYRKIKEVSPMLCGVPLTEMDQIVITVAINCFQFIHTDNNNYKQEVLQSFYQEADSIYICIKNLIQQFEEEFNILFSQDEEFIFNLLQYIKQITYRYQFIPGVTLPTGEEHIEVKEKHAVTFQKVYEIYKKWIKKHSFIPYVYEEDVIVLTLQIEATIQLKRLCQKKALLYLGDSILWKRYVQIILYKEFGHKLMLSTEEVLDIYTCDIHKLDVDFILTTIPLTKMEIPVIQISVIPTRRELEDIKVFLDSIFNT
ncbi:BglG family transcription antiterminator [Bacillus thuringiensis]|uniref:Capsule synthesis positive regulator AcpB n=1 Tax=Bacillus thuringiensis Bt18247 TaxID=1423143 RepID=A0A9W3SZZ9_BACTU|nr:helix-turn-helix domain-containing protein [Bacillus thuringiensis]AOM14309.1 Capsule synthesis positive regulator AcpB [Bacillus thuringiensis Bt18247]